MSNFIHTSNCTVMQTFYTKTKKGFIQGSLRNANITMFHPRSEFIYHNSVDTDSSYEP